MKYLLRSYSFNLLDLCRQCYLKNIALTWVTLGKNSKFDTLHSFWTHYGKIRIFSKFIYYCTPICYSTMLNCGLCK